MDTATATVTAAVVGSTSSTFLATILTALIPVLTTVLTGALTWALARLSSWITAKTKNEAAAGVIVRLNDAAINAVKFVEQTIVADLKEAAKDGEVTPEELARAKRRAIEAARAKLGPKGLAELLKVSGAAPADVDRLIGDQIEAAIHDLRAADAAAAEPPR